MIARLLRSRRRAARRDPHAVTLDRPVISIGNISMGGRGKTPLTALVARLLVGVGEHPAILSRGYGRAAVDDGVTVVSAGRTLPNGDVDLGSLADLAHSGDEPLMLARAVPGAAVVVCEQRATAGVLAETALGCTVHILDDGFQHHQLRRDIDIVLVAPEDFSSSVLPFGRLREPLDSLEDADAILIDGDGAAHTASDALASLRRGPDAFDGSLIRGLGAPVPSVAIGARVVAVAGIATPTRFFTALASAGWSVAETLPFKDHHPYSAADARRIAETATHMGAAAIATTSKDVIKLAALGPWPVPLVEMPLVVSVDPADAFRAWLLNAVARRRGPGGR